MPRDSHSSPIKPPTLPFPPVLTIDELLANAVKSKKPKVIIPNSFIIYRMSLHREYRNKQMKLPSMKKLSKIAKSSWNKESQIVKNEYIKLAKDAKTLYDERKKVGASHVDHYEVTLEAPNDSSE
ncbi:13002_t:CDS:1 [Funneliformis geosporum]|uniref:7770_t:CDS:1 n=1 Tax=Funneliformis geosporum TaxID=1117311 RepID=A0A9W4T2M5_9GLOM|nr:7770_t:CDS:1 [Funneliformis geosporum]CAI2190933.1 13002_t:CDS:1 [Funneliformis geosporum]